MSLPNREGSCLIIGGTGFIGSHLAEKLLEEGWNVNVIDRYEGWKDRMPDDVHFEITDVHDVEWGAVPEHDHVFYLAGVSHTVSSARGIQETYRSGVYGLTKVLDEVSDWESLERVYIASTSLASGILQNDNSVLGEEPGSVMNDATIIDTEDSYHPYVGNKLAMEMALRDYSEVEDVPYTIFRFGTQYGERMNPNVVTYYFIEALVEGNRMEIHGDGSQKRQHMYVKDTVDGMAAAMIPDAEGEVISLVPSHLTSIHDLAVEMQKVGRDYYNGKTSGIEFTDERSLDLKVDHINPNIDVPVDYKNPEDGLRGLRKTLKWYDENWEDRYPPRGDLNDMRGE